MAEIFPWTFQVEEWNADHTKIRELIAGIVNIYVAHAAYDESCRQRPDRPIYLRNGMRVIKQSHQKPPK